MAFNTLGRRHTGRANRAQSGFTLVEMAIVLAVIGLIIGAIAIGKDIQRNAEYTKIKNKFVDQWEQAYNAHYQRAGVVVGDSQTAQRVMVNGANFGVDPVAGAALAAPLSGGNMTATPVQPAVCNGALGAAMRAGLSGLNLRTEMNRHGVRMPPGRAEGQEDRYVYLDSNGNPQEMQVCFRWNNPSLPEGSGNVMVISGLTPDLARMLDQMIDGKPDAREGRFRLQGVLNATANAPGIEWTGNNTFAMGEAAPAAAAAGTTLDEAQVMTMVAIYKMNQ